jgi:hypothetical protein
VPAEPCPPLPTDWLRRTIALHLASSLNDFEDKVRHTGNQTLAEHVNRAVGVRTAQGFVLSSQKSPGPIEAARCMVWAVSAVSRPQNKAKPMLVVM